MANILLVEDDPDFAAFVQRALTRAGHTVTWARHGGAALVEIPARCWDLVVTDLFMPEADGFEILQALRTRCSATPVIAMSGGPRASRGYDYLRALAKLHAPDATLYKPFAASHLLDEVARLLTPYALAA